MEPGSRLSDFLEKSLQFDPNSAVLQGQYLLALTASGQAEAAEKFAASLADAPDQDGPQKQPASCAWAANHADFAAPTPPVLALPSQHMVAALVPPAPTALIAARATGLPPSTGPPRPL